MDRTFIDRRASESERQRAREVAQSVLDGRTTVLEAVRELVYLAHTDAIADVEDRRPKIKIKSKSLGGSMNAIGIWIKPLAQRTLPRARLRVHWRFQPRKRLRENRS